MTADRGMQPFVPVTDAGLMAMQRDMIRMLEAALKIYAPDDPALVKLNEVRASLKKNKPRG